MKKFIGLVMFFTVAVKLLMNWSDGQSVKLLRHDRNAQIENARSGQSNVVVNDVGGTFSISSKSSEGDVVPVNPYLNK